MNPFQRKSRFSKLVDSIESNEALKSAAITAAEAALAGATSQRQAEKVAKALGSLDSGKQAKKSSPFKAKARSALMVGAGVAAVVAASASVSSARRRESAAEAPDEVRG